MNKEKFKETGDSTMFMNRKSDYALRIIRALADGKRHTANSLATNEQIPLAFAYKILK